MKNEQKNNKEIDKIINDENKTEKTNYKETSNNIVINEIEKIKNVGDNKEEKQNEKIKHTQNE